MRFPSPMAGERSLVSQVRAVMAPGNPVPGGHGLVPEPDERFLASLRADLESATQSLAPDWPQPYRDPAGTARQLARTAAGRYSALPAPARRILAPAAAALAVLGVTVGLLLAGGQASGPVTGQPAGRGQPVPAYYVTINGLPPHASVVVHASVTRRETASVHIPASPGGIPVVTAGQSDRTFLIAVPAASRTDRITTILYLLRIPAGGHPAKLTKLPVRLTSPVTQASVDGMALSPDGTRLAIATQQPTTGFHPLAQVSVFTLRGNAVIRTRTWSAAGDSAMPWDPAWQGGSRFLTFLLQDHLTGPVNNYTGRTQVRLLDTSAPGRDLLTARVLASGGGRLGFIESAYARPHRPILASAVADSSAGATGTATVRLVEISPATGRVVSTIAKFSRRYRNLAEKDDAAYSCLVFGVDAAGTHALVSCPRFGALSGRRMIKLPAGHGPVFGAAWR